MAVCECYIAMREMDDHLQNICIEEQRTMAEPMEGLEKITLDDTRPKRTTSIEILASSLVCQALTMFLRENQDMFT